MKSLKNILSALAPATVALSTSCAGVPSGDESDKVSPASTVLAAWSNAQRVTVVMTEYRFTPDHIRFRQGVRYRLRLENAGAELHEFTASAFFQAIDVANSEILTAGGQEVVLQPGEEKEILFRSAPARALRPDLR
jgi:hypothetical protein